MHINRNYLQKSNLLRRCKLEPYKKIMGTTESSMRIFNLSNIVRVLAVLILERMIGRYSP